MFGLDNHTVAAGPSASKRPAAADVARIDTHLTQVILSAYTTEGPQVFFDSQTVPLGTLESVGVQIVAPSDSDRVGTLTGILSQYSGESVGDAPRPQSTTQLFPGTIEVIARGRRIVITCRESGSFDGLWLGLGLRADGTSSELTGVHSLRLLITPSLLDGRLTWEDGDEEDLFAQ